MGWSALIAAALAGLLGGAHCLAMCGGFASALSGASAPATVPLRPARSLALRQLPHNLGRIATYGVLGALAGAAGSTALDVAQFLPLQRTLYVLANIALLALAWSVLSGSKGLAFLQQAGAGLFGSAQRLIGPLARRDALAARLLVGSLWGLVPCAMTYSVLPVALFAGGAWQGAAVMLAFGAGTLPNLLAAGWVAARARQWLDRVSVRAGAAVLLASFAAVGIWRAFGDPSMLAQGPFCLVH